MPIFHNVIQGTSAWHNLRAGVPTSSSFEKIVTPTGKPSRSAHGYLCYLIAERLMGHPIESYASVWMENGKEKEYEAIKNYEFQRDCDTEVVGFVTNDAGTIGASPDRLVGDRGLLEIKVPKPETHVSYLLFRDVDRDYYPQIQGQLWICERDWVDILSYNPEMPDALIRVERDDEYIKTLAHEVTRFALHLEQTYNELIKSGLMVPKVKRDSTLVEMLKQSLIEINRAKGVEFGANDIPV